MSSDGLLSPTHQGAYGSKTEYASRHVKIVPELMKWVFEALRWYKPRYIEWRWILGQCTLSAYRTIIRHIASRSIDSVATSIVNVID